MDRELLFHHRLKGNDLYIIQRRFKSFWNELSPKNLELSLSAWGFFIKRQGDYIAEIRFVKPPTGNPEVLVSYIKIKRDFKSMFIFKRFIWREKYGLQ